MTTFDAAVFSPYSLPTVTVQIAEAQGCNSAWPRVHCIGTGGTASIEYHLRRRAGYALFPVQPRVKPSPSDLSKAYVELMQEIKQVFERTFSRMPTVFGVSRQTLYNWLDGDVPKSANRRRIIELAQAARVFSQHRYTPTTLDLTRTLARGKSFLDLIAEGEEGQLTAEKLVRLIQHGLAARVKLDAALAGTNPAALQSSDFGAPAVDED